jgi:hypothetical protein
MAMRKRRIGNFVTVVTLSAGLMLSVAPFASAQKMYDDDVDGPIYVDCTEYQPERLRNFARLEERDYEYKRQSLESTLRWERSHLDRIPPPIDLLTASPEKRAELMKWREEDDKRRADFATHEKNVQAQIAVIDREKAVRKKASDERIAAEQVKYDDCVKRQAQAREEYQLRRAEKTLFEVLMLAGAMAQSEEDVDRFWRSVDAHRRLEKIRAALRQSDETPQTLAPEQQKKVEKRKPPAERVKRAQGQTTPQPTREIHSPDATAVTIMLLGTAAGAASQGLRRPRDHHPPPQPAPHGHW